MTFYKFTRAGGEPFWIEKAEIAGFNVRGLIVRGGQEVHTEMTHDELENFFMRLGYTVYDSERGKVENRFGSKKLE